MWITRHVSTPQRGVESKRRTSLELEGAGFSLLAPGRAPAPRVRERSRRSKKKKFLRGKGVGKGKGKGKGWRFVLQRIIFHRFRTIAALWYVSTFQRKIGKWLLLLLLPLSILFSYRSLEFAFAFTSDPVFHLKEKGKVKIANRKRKRSFLYLRVFNTTY